MDHQSRQTGLVPQSIWPFGHTSSTTQSRLRRPDFRLLGKRETFVRRRTPYFSEWMLHKHSPHSVAKLGSVYVHDRAQRCLRLTKLNFDVLQRKMNAALLRAPTCRLLTEDMRLLFSARSVCMRSVLHVCARSRYFVPRRLNHPLHYAGLSLLPPGVSHHVVFKW